MKSIVTKKIIQSLICVIITHTECEIFLPMQTINAMESSYSNTGKYIVIYL